VNHEPAYNTSRSRGLHRGSSYHAHRPAPTLLWVASRSHHLSSVSHYRFVQSQNRQSCRTRHGVSRACRERLPLSAPSTVFRTSRDETSVYCAIGGVLFALYDLYVISGSHSLDVGVFPD